MLQAPALQRLVAILILTACAAVVSGFAGHGQLFGDQPLTPIDPVSLAAMIALLVGAIGTVVWHRRRYLALLYLSVVGLVIALAFIKFSAPDLALTQLSVEVVTIMLLLMALYFLPQHTPAESSQSRRGRDLKIAVLAGSCAALLTWAVLSRPYEAIAGFFLANSVPGGGGTNVVNVILVDFRGFDTLGEITVLAIAAIGIFALLEGLKLYAPTADASDRPWNWDTHPLIMATFSRLLLPLALMVAIFILLRGHNQPGGGFIAGLITTMALIMQYLANGIAWTRRRITGKLYSLIGIGLLIATATGLAAGLIEPWLLPLALATIVFGAAGVLASQSLSRLVAFLVVGSAGTLLTACGLGGTHAVAGGLYYLAHTTFAVAALFLLADVIARVRGEQRDCIISGPALPQNNLLGGVFLIAAVAIAGLPPLSGFLGKFLILDASIGDPDMAWVLGVVLVTSLLIMVSLARSGSRLFYKVDEAASAAALTFDRRSLLPAVVLTAFGMALVVFAGPAHDFTLRSHWNDAEHRPVHRLRPGQHRDFNVAVAPGYWTEQARPYPGARYALRQYGRPAGAARYSPCE